MLSSPSASEMKLLWRRHNEQVARGDVVPNLRIGVGASFTANPLLPFLGADLLQSGAKPFVELAPFNQIFQICFDPASYFVAPDVIVLLFRLEDLVLEEITTFLNGDAEGFQQASAKMAQWVSALGNLRQNFKGTILVNLPPFPTQLPACGLSLENPGRLGHLHRTLTGQLVQSVIKIAGILLLDLDALQREVGLAVSFDARQWYLYRQPFSEAFLFQAGALLSRMIMATRQAPKKCVVLDCDNTLWGGIIGEDGLSGIELGDEFPGTAYRDFQRLLLYWQRRGVLLAIASKNNEAEVWEVFEKHQGMVIKREHLSKWKIDWSAKSDNISQIARELNIGIDSLVFIDDNPIEVEQMRMRHPEVQSILLPEDPAEILSYLHSLALFDRLEVTREDRSRTEMMQAEQQREELGRKMSKEDFRRSLELRLDLFSPQSIDMERIAQLINKTNQFNLTTMRRSLDEVRELALSPVHRVFGLRTADKFGDYGLTGVVILEILEDGQCWAIDTLLLSCRVLGRGVETALLALIAEQAASQGAEELVGTFIPSAKNMPASSFLPDHGFQKKSDERWHIDIAHVPPLCPSVIVTPSPGKEGVAVLSS